MLSAVVNDNTAVCIVAQKLIWILYWSNSEPFTQTGILEEGMVSELLHTSCKPVHKPQQKQTSSTSTLMSVHQHPALSLLKETCWKSRLQESCQEHSHTQWTESQLFVTQNWLQTPVSSFADTKIWKLLLAGSSTSCINRNENKI